MDAVRTKRFWEKVLVKGPNECWLWTASVNSKGYGSFGHSYKKTQSAHKISWALAKNDGVLSDPGMHIMHTCDVKRCVNPNHLELGTPKQNAIDAHTRGLVNLHRPSLESHCKRGHERTEENTRIDADGYAACIPCRKENDRKAYEKRKQKVTVF